MTSNPVGSIDEQFVSDYVAMCRENGERATAEEIVTYWLDQNGPADPSDELRATLLSQVEYYIN